MISKVQADFLSKLRLHNRIRPIAVFFIVVWFAAFLAAILCHNPLIGTIFVFCTFTVPAVLVALHFYGIFPLSCPKCNQSIYSNLPQVYCPKCGAPFSVSDPSWSGSLIHLFFFCKTIGQCPHCQTTISFETGKGGGLVRGLFTTHHCMRCGVLLSETGVTLLDNNKWTGVEDVPPGITHDGSGQKTAK